MSQSSISLNPFAVILVVLAAMVIMVVYTLRRASPAHSPVSARGSSIVDLDAVPQLVEVYAVVEKDIEGMWDEGVLVSVCGSWTDSVRKRELMMVWR